MRFSTRQRAPAPARVRSGFISSVLSAMPLLDELVQSAVFPDFGQASVQGIDEFAALRNGEAELLAGLDAADGYGEFTGVRVHELICGGVVDHPTVDVAVQQRLDGGVEVIVQLDAVTADQVLRGQRVGGASLRTEGEAAFREVLEGLVLVVHAHRDRLVDDEVRVGEVDDLGALGGDGYAGGNRIELTGSQGGEDAVPGSGDELGDAVDALADGVEHVDVEADDVAVLVYRLERRVSRVGTDADGGAVQVLRESESEQGSCCDGNKLLHGLLLWLKEIVVWLLRLEG